MKHSIPMQTTLAAVTGAILLFLAACADGGDSHGSALQISGALERPADVTVQQLRQQSAVTQSVSYVSGADNGIKTRTYTGASTWALLDSLGLKTDPAKKGDLLNRFLLATGADGYQVTLSSGELNLALGNKQSIIAYDEERADASVPLGDDGSLLMTVPGDRRGSRYMLNLVRLEWRAPPAPGPIPAAVGGATSGVTVYGAVDKPMRFDIAALQALPATTLRVGSGSYTGVSLWTVLNTVTGIDTRNSPQKKYPTLRMAAVATASDGYAALLALGEIDPTFGNRNVLLAYSVDGQPLDRSGPIRLVVAGDGKTGRSVSNLESIRVFVAE